MKKLIIVVTASASILPFAAPAQQGSNQQSQQTQVQETPNQAPDQARRVRPSITSWSYEPLYREGWSIRSLYHYTIVVEPDGGDIGSIENVILSNNGRVQGVIAEIGGLWDIGDTHLFIPWDQVRINARYNRVVVPVTEDTADDYNFTDSELWKSELQRIQAVDSAGYTAGPAIWKLSDVLGDYAYLSNNEGYGYVYDLIIGFDGLVRAVVVNADTTYGGGYRALPWPGYFNFGTRPYYDVGYDRADIDRLPRFEYARIDGGSTIRNDSASATTGAGNGDGR